MKRKVKDCGILFILSDKSWLKINPLDIIIVFVQVIILILFHARIWTKIHARLRYHHLGRDAYWRRRFAEATEKKRMHVGRLISKQIDWKIGSKAMSAFNHADSIGIPLEFLLILYWNLHSPINSALHLAIPPALIFSISTSILLLPKVHTITRLVHFS